MTENTALSGIDAIADFCRSILLPASKASILQMIRDENFPAKKIGGVWDSDKEAIIKWRRERLMTENGFTPEAAGAKKKKAKN